MTIRIVIIGSGPTAIGAALRLRELQLEGDLDIEVTLLEKEKVVGGLASSVTDQRGFTWDLGVHVMGATKYKEFEKTTAEAVGQWNEIPRCVKANMKHIIQANDPLDNYVPYPVQDSIPYFPDHEKECCLSDLENLESTSSAPAKNFSEFSEQVFGITLRDIFIQPYNEKVWTVPLKELSCVWVEGRVPKPNWQELTKRCRLTISTLHEQEEQKPKTVFRYPATLRGVGAMWKKIAYKLPKGWIQLEKAVASIDAEEKLVHCTDASIHPYDFVISTMPIVELGRISKLMPEIKLKHSKVLLVGLGIRRPQPEVTENWSWVYFPQPDIIFYRCTFISNFNESLTPNAAVFWSVVCEIGMDSDAEVVEEEAVEKTIQGLKTAGILYENNTIVSKWFCALPYGYPIPTINRDYELAKCQPVFEKKGIFSRGRFGSWKYESANQDHSFTMGREVVDRIFMNKPEKLN